MLSLLYLIRKHIGIFLFSQLSRCPPVSLKIFTFLLFVVKVMWKDFYKYPFLILGFHHTLMLASIDESWSEKNYCGVYWRMIFYLLLLLTLLVNFYKKSFPFSVYVCFYVNLDQWIFILFHTL